MMFLFLFSIFLLTGFAVSDFHQRDPIKVPPVWSKVYTVKGILTIPYAELREPFYAWYDEPNSVSRIDYYGGMVKTYQVGPSGDYKYGSSFKIAPVTTEKQLNQQTCLQVNGSDETTVGVQSILPDLTGFEYYGEETMRGEQAQKWRMTETFGEKTNKYTIWIKYRRPSGEISDPLPIPVRYEMRGFNSLLGSHYDHYYLDYDEYSVDDISKDVFIPDTKLPCVNFPGPGVKHLYTFNPMMEFVHPAHTEHVEDEFNRFTGKHKKHYKHSKEHAQRKEIFRQNLRYINSLNRANKGFTLTVNHLADRSDKERAYLRGRQFSQLDNGASPFPYNDGHLQSLRAAVPKEWDWRLQGAVTPVKDQSVCGSCWSFGTIGTVEGALFLKNGGHLKRLSQQVLIDCSWGFGNNGCDGGEDFRSYQWIMKHGGVPLEDEYGGYLGQDGYCHSENVTLLAPITGYVNVTANNPDALRLAIFKHGPISVAIDASQKTFSFYSNGVYYDPKCHNKIDELDHAVLAVGYGTLNGEDYWLIKNSWSNYWGNDGYILMSAKNNNCGVETTPTYVTM